MSFLGKLFKKEVLDTKFDNLPSHIAIIMDGNGRWAKKRGLPRNIGHREGSNTLQKVVDYCSDIGIKHLTVYAFSTENWKRPKSEVNALMSLLLEYLKKAERELEGKNYRVRVLGDISQLSPEIQEQVKRVEGMTKENTGLNFNIALNYGSRDELIFAARALASDVKHGKLGIEDINDKELSNRLYTSGIPDPELLIRTSGEKRVSNFLLWQLAYSEFIFMDVLWPDFKKSHILEAIEEYQRRNRRFGGV